MPNLPLRPLIVVVLFIVGVSFPAFSVTSSSCTEALMRFTHFVDIEKSPVSLQEKRSHIQDQLDFMFGGLASDDVLGVPRGDHKVRIKKTESLPGGGTRVHYDYKGMTLLQKGPRKYTTFPLPRIPTKEGIYDPAVDSKGINRATDLEYNGFEDYWYFFDPYLKKSGLKEGVHFDVIKATIERRKNTKSSVPEYERMLDLKTNTIPMTVFFGMDDYEHSTDANRARDLGALGYRAYRQGLLDMGFTRSEFDPKRLGEIFMGKKIEKPFLETFTKVTPKGVIAIDMFYGPTGKDEPSKPFHYLYKHALETSAVMTYDGHSGLGENLDLDLLEKTEGFRIQHHPSRYQLLHFNGCSTYSYYNTTYHVLKGRKLKKAKTLDILANGLSTEFDVTQSTNLALIQAIDRWAMTGKKTKYQALAKEMEAENLFSVNGDEDNPPR